MRDGNERDDGGRSPGDAGRDLADEAIGGALRRVDGEARPREEFRSRLRAAFVAGGLHSAGAGGSDADPSLPDRPGHPDLNLPVDGSLAGFRSEEGSGGGTEDAGPGRPGRIPFTRWFAYPAAAAALLAALALSGALEAPTVPDPPVSMVKPIPAPERAMLAAERRLQVNPVFMGRRWQHRAVEGRPVLLPAEVVFASPPPVAPAPSPGSPGDTGDLASLCRAITKAEAFLAAEFPAVAGRSFLPEVIVVAPSRAAFAETVAPRIAPVPLGESTVAFALEEEGFLLLSPGVLDAGGPPCEAMDIVHESVHAWLHARRATKEPNPLWLEEGLAGIVSAAGVYDSKAWCGRLLAEVRSCNIDPTRPAEALDFRSYAAMAKVFASRAPCEQRPFVLLSAFHAHAESLVEFLLDGEPAAPRRAAFASWLGRVLDGERMDAAATAAALGFPDPASLFAARDAWLEK